MKKYHRNSTISKTQEENKLLQEETRKMEQRLQMLKNALRKEEPKEIKGSNSPLWDASSLSSTAQNLKGTEGKLDLTKIKLKTLRRENITDSVKHTDNKYTELLKRVISSSVSPPEPVSDNRNTSQCGQCENKPAVVSCQECSEDYCARCFAQFHMKGALRRHHSLPISASRSSFRQAEEQSSEERQKKTNTVHMESHGCQSEGNAVKRAISTVQAACGDNIPMTNLTQYESRGTSVERKTVRPLTEQIEFTPTLSYAERLLVHRNRRDLVGSEGNSNTCKKNNDATSLSELVVEDTEDGIDADPEVCNRPTFEELHRLATQELTPAEFYSLYQAEQSDRSPSRIVSSACASKPIVDDSRSDLESSNVDLSSAPTAESQKLPEAKTTNGNQDSSPSLSVLNLESEENATVVTSHFQCDIQDWYPDVTYSTGSNTESELNTIELIKQHLHRMTTNQK